MGVADAVREWRARYPQILETALPVAIVATVLLAAATRDDPARRPLDALGVLLVLAANLPLLVRRRVPIAVLLACSAGVLAFSLAGYWESLVGWGVLVALYTVATAHPPRVGLPLTALAWAVNSTSGLIGGEGPALLIVVLGGGLTVPAWALGHVRQLLTERNLQLAVLTERLAQDRVRQRQRAVMEERVRIARELHDVVAHHMSVISVQAGLARYVIESDPATAAAALRTVASTSSEALEDLRRTLRLLRVEGPAGEPGAVASAERGLDRLAERVSAAGLPVAVTVTGTPWPLNPGADLSVFRVVQESLTNALKHAGPATAEVALAYETDRLVVRISDNGRGEAGNPAGNTASSECANAPPSTAGRFPRALRRTADSRSFSPSPIRRR
ncbi:sensor histidine kinase [Actinokineospora soli]|uniref:histidine kinase n=1 Tax=Actinokineospora soli TaxID=1048753 RepID=A0ABW2TVK3_9PSEU